MKDKLKKILYSHLFLNCLLGVIVTVVAVSIAITPVSLLISVNKISDGVVYRGREDCQTVALTFNVYQGTSQVEEILRILDEKQASATFYIGGCWADDNIEVVQKILKKGHEIGSHGYFHKDHAKLSLEENLAEIKFADDLIKAICGSSPTLFAPPSGSFSKDTVKACESMGYRVIMWSKDTIDWRDKDSDLIFERATKDLVSGDIILMHPTAQTVTALPKIIDAIYKCGLKASKVSAVL